MDVTLAKKQAKPPEREDNVEGKTPSKASTSSTKRPRCEESSTDSSDSSDSSEEQEGREEVAGSVKSTRLDPSQDLFKTPAELLPLPPEDENEESSKLDTNDNQKETTLETPQDPDDNDGKHMQTSQATDSMEFPLTQRTQVKLPSVKQVSPTSSADFNLFSSKKTRPRPVFGSGRTTRSRKLFLRRDSVA
jgi:hypothetical protein